MAEIAAALPAKLQPKLMTDLLSHTDVMVSV